MSFKFTRLALATIAVLLPTFAFAHTGAGHGSGFVHGFVHPVGGIDHILAMVAVGMFAANLGGRALWAVPLTFMALMGVGSALCIAGVTVPFVEAGIAASVVVLGLAVALRLQWPVAAAMALVGAFAIFHGYAHGAEIPQDASGAAYASGFLLATGLLHLAGIGIGFALAQLGGRYSPRLTQAGGAATAVAGVVLLAGAVA